MARTSISSGDGLNRPGEPTSPPIVSVLLPVYNAMTTLSACVRSIQRQRLSNWECVVVDDGSTDETGEMVCRAARSDGRLRLLRVPHVGLVAALQEGLRHCRGRYVARMDADDLMHADRLALQARVLDERHDLAGVGCQVRLFPRQHLRQGLRAYERWLNALTTPELVRRDAFIECPLAHPTLMLRRECLLALGYRDEGWPEDYDLVLRALERGWPLVSVPRRLLIWRDDPTRLSRTDARYSREAFARCKARYLRRLFLRDQREYVLCGYGETGKLLRKALAAEHCHPTHIVEVKPSRIGKRIHGAEVIPHIALPALRGSRVIVSVAHEGPRTEARAALAAMGFVEQRDFVCAA